MAAAMGARPGRVTVHCWSKVRFIVDCTKTHTTTSTQREKEGEEEKEAALLSIPSHSIPSHQASNLSIIQSSNHPIIRSFVFRFALTSRGATTSLQK